MVGVLVVWFVVSGLIVVIIYLFGCCLMNLKVILVFGFSVCSSDLLVSMNFMVMVGYLRLVIGLCLRLIVLVLVLMFFIVFLV